MSKVRRFLSPLSIGASSSSARSSYRSAPVPRLLEEPPRLLHPLPGSIPGWAFPSTIRKSGSKSKVPVLRASSRPNRAASTAFSHKPAASAVSAWRETKVGLASGSLLHISFTVASASFSASFDPSHRTRARRQISSHRWSPHSFRHLEGLPGLAFGLRSVFGHDFGIGRQDIHKDSRFGEAEAVVESDPLLESLPELPDPPRELASKPNKGMDEDGRRLRVDPDGLRIRQPEGQESGAKGQELGERAAAISAPEKRACPESVHPQTCARILGHGCGPAGGDPPGPFSRAGDGAARGRASRGGWRGGRCVRRSCRRSS